VSGQSYELTTIADLAALFGKLPADRGEVLLLEICEGVRLLAPIAALVEARGAELSALGPFTWTDDDKREGTTRLFGAEGGEPAAAFTFRAGELESAEFAADTKTVEYGGRTYRKFIRQPEPVDDGTVRCWTCGQIDEPEAHDDALCPATATTPSPTGEPAQ